MDILLLIRSIYGKGIHLCTGNKDISLVDMHKRSGIFAVFHLLNLLDISLSIAITLNKRLKPCAIGRNLGFNHTWNIGSIPVDIEGNRSGAWILTSGLFLGHTGSHEG